MNGGQVVQPPISNRVSRAGRAQVVGHRLQIPRSTITSGANSLQHESRISFRIGSVDVQDLQFGFCPWFDQESAGTGEAAIATTGTIACALERTTPLALATVGTFNGLPTASLPPGYNFLFSDKFAGTCLANTDYFAQSSYKVTTLADVIPIAERGNHSADRGFLSNGVSTQIGTVTTWSTPASGSSSTDGWGPSIVIGVPKVPIPAVMLFGHSRPSGFGDTKDNFGNLGYAARALGNMDASHNIIPYAGMCRPGNKLSYEDYNPSYRKRAVYNYFTHVLWDNAVNDIAANAVLATMQAQALREFTEFKAAGLHVTVVLQVSKSTGAWTLANGSDQTLAAAFQIGGLCDQFNAWLLTLVGGGLVDQALDPRSLVMDLTTNKWLADGTVAKYTADGTHFNVYSSTLIADSLIRPWALTLSVGIR